jgi:hypothetical protein
VLAAVVDSVKARWCRKQLAAALNGVVLDFVDVGMPRQLLTEVLHDEVRVDGIVKRA